MPIVVSVSLRKQILRCVIYLIGDCLGQNYATANGRILMIVEGGQN